jgi:hypothetical protein
LRSFNEPHQAVHRRGDGLNLVRHPGVDFQDARNGSVFLGAAIGYPMLRSGFAFHSCQTPHARQKCSTGAKARRFSKVAELTDLCETGEPRERSLDHGAGVALPYLR